MDTRKSAIGAIVASLLVLAGCAVSPEEERKRQEMEADIDDILSQHVDPDEYGEATDCLSEARVRTYHSLGDRHLLFKGKQGQLWVNVLRTRCPGLDRNSVLVMRPNLPGRLCDMDRFRAADRVGSGVAGGASCSLGEFKPITEAQLEEVQNLLDTR